MSEPVHADTLPDDAPSIVAQKALMKAIWRCIVDASSMNVVMSGREVNEATRQLRAAIEREAVAQERARLRAAVEGLPDVNPTPTVGEGRSTDWPMVRRAAVLRLLDPEAEGGTP